MKTRYSTKTEAELRYIIKDAGEAADAMRNHNAQAEGKYLDQVNDAVTELYRRREIKRYQDAITGADPKATKKLIKGLKAAWGME